MSNCAVCTDQFSNEIDDGPILCGSCKKKGVVQEVETGDYYLKQAVMEGIPEKELDAIGYCDAQEYLEDLIITGEFKEAEE